MLKMAVKARLPLIAAYTRDTMNLPEVLPYVIGSKVLPFTGPATPNSVMWYRTSQPQKWADIYKIMTEAGSSLILINPKTIEPEMFNAGEIPVPKELLLKGLSQIVKPEVAKELLKGLGGCTMKEAAEYAMLTMARDASLTVKGLLTTRKAFFQASGGMSHIDPDQPFYDPHPELETWMVKERDQFLNGKDFRLVPRGLLLDGPPGTGKSSGAKHIASTWGVPLYRIDVGGVKNKYIGESERQMMEALNRLDHEEPCIALFDEIEKVFGQNKAGEDHGTTTTMLSQLLWWLQEHRTKVLTIMTTNNIKALPPELYRPGRIDRVMYLGGMEVGKAMNFAMKVVQTFPKEAQQITAPMISEAMGKLFKSEALPTNPETISQSAVTTMVYGMVKEVMEKSSLSNK